MRISYDDFGFLATGGALGCGLFFFISGYVMAYTRTTTFSEWIQKRLGRFLPPILVTGFICGFGITLIFSTTYLWFVHCLIAYFIAFYFIKKYAFNHLTAIIVLSSVVYSIYFFYSGHAHGFMYGPTAGKYFLFFIFYLSGIAFRRIEYRPQRAAFLASLILTPVLLAADMILRFLIRYQGLSDYLLLISPVLLISGMIGLFIITDAFNHLRPDAAFRRWAAPVFASIAAISLESYIGIALIHTPLQQALLPLFPYNIPLVMGVMLLFSYFLRVCTRLCMVIISGKTENFNLRYILQPY